LGLNKAPIYIHFKNIRDTHIQVMGATGTGKGVLMTLIAYQCILAGESLIWFDPKFDRFSPRIMRMAAKLAGKKFHMINLNPEQPPQFNILKGAHAHEIEELLVSGFDLIGKGTDGDFHRGKDEDAAFLAAKVAVKNDACSIPALISQCLGVDEITKQENFWRKLKKLNALSVINTSSGLNLIDAIQKGHVIYIVGSTENERVKMLQKMLVIRVMQIIKKQDRSQETTPTCVILDEFKHILSPTALTGLGVVRDFNSHFILAHQSLGDLDSCAGITRSEAEGAVLDNTAIKFIYKLGDADHAEKLSKISGKRKIFVEQVSKGVDDNNSESGGWRETHVPSIDLDVLTHLPMPSDRDNQPSTGVIFGVGKAKVFYVHHIAVSEDMPVPRVALEYKGDAATDAGDLI
jgi:type IV secretory pathway TraG/TraD family ATPase VirD4